MFYTVAVAISYKGYVLIGARKPGGERDERLNANINHNSRECSSCMRCLLSPSDGSRH